MIRGVRAPLAQDESGGASSLGRAQECECGSVFIIFSGRGWKTERVGGRISNKLFLRFFVIEGRGNAHILFRRYIKVECMKMCGEPTRQLSFFSFLFFFERSSTSTLTEGENVTRSCLHSDDR